MQFPKNPFNTISQYPNIPISILVILGIVVGVNVHAQWSAPSGAPPTGNPPPPVWIQTVSPGTTQPGNIHIGNNAIIQGVLGLGGVPDTSRGQKLDINGSGNAPLVVRNGASVVLGVGTNFIGTITDHPLQLWANNGTRMVVQGTGNVGINQLLPAHKLDVGGDINTTGVYRVGTTAGINLAAPCAAGDVLKGVNVKGGIIVAGSCASDATGGGGGGGMANPMTSTGDMIYGGTGGAATRLVGAAGFLKSTGATAPAWSPLTPTDIPDLGGSYIKNGTTLQSSAHFNISGNGFVGSTLGIGTTSTAAKFMLQHAAGTIGTIIHNGTSGLKIINPVTGPELGTWNNYPVAFFTGDTKRMIITGSSGVLSGRVGIGAHPSGATDVNARLVVCRTGSIAAGTLCTIPTNNATVAVFGSADDATTGSSIRARGFIEAQGGFRTPAGGSIQSGMTDLGEYVKVQGEASEYGAGDILVISKKSGVFAKSTTAYAVNVAGIVTTTAGYIGGVNESGNAPSSSHVVMALVGQVTARVSPENGSIAAGDLLTTSSTQGTLMKCPMETTEHKLRCIGAVVAKALEPFSKDRGTIKVLLTLQ